MTNNIIYANQSFAIALIAVIFLSISFCSAQNETASSSISSISAEAEAFTSVETPKEAPNDIPANHQPDAVFEPLVISEELSALYSPVNSENIGADILASSASAIPAPLPVDFQTLVPSPVEIVSVVPYGLSFGSSFGERLGFLMVLERLFRFNSNGLLGGNGSLLGNLMILDWLFR